jgi:LysM repeat protein
MTHRSLRISSLAILTLALAAATSFAQTAAPATAPATPPQSASAATPAPAPVVAEPATPTESGPRPATYTLQQGDTLESVGKQWGLTGRQLQKYNKFTNSQVRRLQIGTVIKIPPAKSTSK